MTAASWPPVHTFMLHVCAACLRSKGTQCWTPGCVFWAHDVPMPDTAQALAVALDHSAWDAARPSSGAS